MSFEGESSPDDVTVSTSVPVFCVHTPELPNRSPVDDTDSELASPVCDPVSPVMVTVDPLSRR